MAEVSSRFVHRHAARLTWAIMFRLTMTIISLLALACACPPAASARAGHEEPSWFESPAGPALKTLPAYIRHYNQALLYAEDDLRNLRTPAVSGHLSAAQAIHLLIAGTGLEIIYAPAANDHAPALVLRLPSNRSARLPAPTTSAEPPFILAPADDEPITLDDLRVSACPADGYRSAHAHTATGLGTPVFDTPVPIAVIGAELLADTPGNELRDGLRRVPGVLTSPRRESQFTIRGLPGLISYRNGHYRRQLFPDWNIDRVEVVKGPPGVFFGGVRPGGVVNLITARPHLRKRFTDIELEAGDGNYQKAGLYTNIPVGHAVALRAGVGALHSERDTDMRVRDERYLGTSLLWCPHDGFRLGLDFETVARDTRQSLLSVPGLGQSRFHAASEAPASPLAVGTPADSAPDARDQIRDHLAALGFSADPASPSFAPTLDTYSPLPPVTRTGTILYSPDSHRDFRSHTVDLEAHARLATDLFWETRLNLARDDARGLRPNDGPIPYSDGTLRVRFEEFLNLRDSWNFNNRLVRAFNLGTTRHTIQLGQDFQRVKFTTGGHADASSSFSQNSYSPWLYWRPGIDAPPSARASIALSLAPLNARRTRTEDQEGYFAALQSRLAKDRLRLLAGARLNRITQRGSFDPAEATASDGSSGLTHQLGLLFAATPSVHLFGTHSSGLEPSGLFDSAGHTSALIRSSGHDLGFKTAFWSGRCESTFTYYNLERDAPPRLDSGRFVPADAGSRVEGLELDLNLSPTDHWQILLGWNRFLRAELNAFPTAGLPARPLAYTPSDTLSLWQRLVLPQGANRRFLVGAGFRHATEARLSADPLNIVVVPSFVTWDAMLGYAFPVASRVVLAQLIIENLTDDDAREGADAAFGPGRSWSLRLSMHF